MTFEDLSIGDLLIWKVVNGPRIEYIIEPPIQHSVVHLFPDDINHLSWITNRNFYTDIFRETDESNT